MIPRSIKNSKLGFYLSLWALYLRYPGGIPLPLTDKWRAEASPSVDLNLLKNKRIHFWVPHNTAGAQFILLEVIPKLIDRLIAQGAELDITISDCFSDDSYDLVFSFKEPCPEHIRAGKKVLVICDEIDRLWPQLDRFDAVVCTSSYELSELIRRKVKKYVHFVPEIEPEVLLKVGEKRSVECSNKNSSIFWHGGPYTLQELVDMTPFFAKLRDSIDFESLEIVCGEGVKPPELSSYPWIRVAPWSRGNLIKVSEKCRLAILPARKSLRNSYLKPATRVRCSYALAIPAVGDCRVPEVVRLSSSLGMPVIDFSDEDSAVQSISKLWRDGERLTDAASNGHIYVKTHHSVDAALSAWVLALSTLLTEI